MFAVFPFFGPAAGGTRVVIIGTGFNGATVVKFGTKAATSVTVDNAHVITATSPAGTGTVDVTVTTAGGTSATSAADHFTYFMRCQWFPFRFFGEHEHRQPRFCFPWM